MMLSLVELYFIVSSSERDLPFFEITVSGILNSHQIGLRRICIELNLMFGVGILGPYGDIFSAGKQ